MTIPFKRPDRLEQIYRFAIQKLIDRYFDIPTFSTLGEINAKLVEYAQANSFFLSLANNLARRMVTQVMVENATSWRAAAKQSSQGRRIYEGLNSILVGYEAQQIIQRNSELISTLPANVAEYASRYVARRATEGARSSTIAKELGPKMGELKEWQIRRIARTEVAKADTAITTVRAEQMGIAYYKWSNSHDERVRASHKIMSNVLVPFNDPPSPEKLAGEKSYGKYQAGETWNCRCIAQPLVRLDQVQWPATVYYAGRLQRFSLKQFAMLSGMQRLAA